MAGAFVVRADVRKNRADLVEIRRGVLQEQLRRLRVAQDRAERLIDLMRQPRRELAHHRDAPRVRDLLPEQLCLLLGLFARGAIAGDAAHPERLAVAKVDATTSGDPTHLPVWKHDAILHGVFTLRLKGAPDRRISSRTIIGMNARDEGRVI